MNSIELSLINLFNSWAGKEAASITPLPQSGSYRKYYRITFGEEPVIGVYNSDKKENRAFIEFTKHFLKYNLPVPQIFAEDESTDTYLISNLGGTTLFSYLESRRITDTFPVEVIDIYKKVIRILPKFQIDAAKDFDYSNCYPRAAFDRQSILWDLHYFKYYFLKLARIPFEEQKLEDAFNGFADFLLEADCNYFLYRDFQSRNIMLVDDEPYFIDYQGGRKGALQYDVASLLYDAKADLPNDVRKELLEYYLEVMTTYPQFNRDEFMKYFYGYVIVRILQAMGAYGFRGFHEKKEHFLQSIPFAVRNLEWIMKNVEFPIQFSYLVEIISRIVNSEEVKKLGIQKENSGNLTVRIFSFSYRKGIPADTTENGGGFVFDCRSINNPGRHEQYKSLTGRDEPVMQFLQTQSEAENFLESVYRLVDSAIENYLERSFANLMVSFGCTGGQHRSVYCAESLNKHLNERYKIKIELKHTELDRVAVNDNAIQTNHPKG
ncbi:MAG: RNase adapter RapZ [bacterium]